VKATKFLIYGKVEMAEQLFCLHTFFNAPVDQGGGEFLVGITRAQGGFGGWISFNQQGKFPLLRKFLIAWFIPGTKYFSDELLIRMAIAQAIAEHRFSEMSAGEDPLKFVLEMSIAPYQGEDLKFFN
jgi:hypothetical protein